MALPVGFIEDFALAEDRGRALEQLIPGTEDHAYFHCLHGLHQGDFDRVRSILEGWIKQYGRTGQVREIEHRLALLGYEESPAESLEYLKDQLDLVLDHARDKPEKEAGLQSAFDEKYQGFEWIAASVLKRYRATLDGFEDQGLYHLDIGSLGTKHRHSLLARLGRPDLEGLAGLLAEDLTEGKGRRYGELAIDTLLTGEQLDELVTLAPSLANEPLLVETRLARLKPPDHVDLERDHAERERYLDRLWGYVQTLSPAHNSLKAHVLHHRLVHDRQARAHDMARFESYLQLPRSAGYANPEYLKRHRAQAVAQDSASSQHTLLPSVGDDEPLVRDYLHHFLAEEDCYDRFAPYVNEAYLKARLAEARILSGSGSREKWFAMLAPAALQELKERVDLDFAPWNRRCFEPTDQVSLDLFVKQVPTLIVKIYEINTPSYYRDNGREIATDMDLDGLAPNHELVFQYEEAPFARVLRRFDLPQLQGSGAWVVDFIGGGISSRALVRKGMLWPAQRLGEYGHEFTIFDQDGRSVDHAEILLAGHRLEADEDGVIVVPYSTAPGEKSVVLVRDGQASLHSFYHMDETWRLQAGFYVDREQLVSGNRASVVVRPRLLVNGVAAPLERLAKARLSITSTDLDGVSATKDMDGLALAETAELTASFFVPERLASLTFTLRGTVHNHSLDQDQELSASDSVGLNHMERTALFEDLHLSRTAKGYTLLLLGKNGEARPGRSVRISLKHRLVRDVISLALATDDAGRIVLGRLSDMERVEAVPPSGEKRSWNILQDRVELPELIQARAGDPIRLPMAGCLSGAEGRATLLERRHGVFVADHTSKIVVRENMHVLEGLAPGLYELSLWPENRLVTIRVMAGEIVGDTGGERIVSAAHALDRSRPDPLAVVGSHVDSEKVVLELSGTSATTRVHVFASCLVPAFDAFAGLSPGSVVSPAMAVAAMQASRYVSGRDIGDEYRYIIERKYADRFPGNMLPRPGLLLAPWVVRRTGTDLHKGREGEEWAKEAEQHMARCASPEPSPRAEAALDGDFESLEFLAGTSVLLDDLHPDDAGRVVVERKRLGNRSLLTMVVVDTETTLVCNLPLDADKDVPACRDIRLAKGLDPGSHVTEQRRLDVLQSGEELVVRDTATARVEVLETLSDLYRLFTALEPGPELERFRFLTTWQDMDEEERRKLYSEHLCHELHLFLYFKDPEFFARVARPHLANKLEKSFLDHWLLAGEEEESWELGRYLEPWAYARLNAAERALLSKKIDDSDTLKRLADVVELLPPDPAAEDRLFAAALGASALEGPTLQFAVHDQLSNGMEGMAMDVPSPAMDLESDEESDAKADTASRGGGGYPGSGDVPKKLRRRRAPKRFHREPDTTREYAETHYWKRSMEMTDEDLVPASRFWLEFAAHEGMQGFVSSQVARAAGSFTEMVLALAVTDLPFTSDGVDIRRERGEIRLAASSPCLVAHRTIQPVEAAEGPLPVLVNQSFFALNDRYATVDGERVEKYLTDGFEPHEVYGCRVTATNPGSSPIRLDMLMEIPQGAIPVQSSMAIRSSQVRLDPFATEAQEFHFYFPSQGDFTQFPVQAASGRNLSGCAEAVSFEVRRRERAEDKDSWEYVSQRASGERVLRYLREENLAEIDLSRMAWRMRDADFFDEATSLLARGHVYDHTLWSYAVLHDRPDAIRTMLQHEDAFVFDSGPALDSPLLTIDPVSRKQYQHLEYSPLINARAHRLGTERTIANLRFARQYETFLGILAHRPALDEHDLMSVVYYLLLQDRVAEALAFFRRIDPAGLASRMQYDYCKAYLALYEEDLETAMGVVEAYQDYPVDRWRDIFTTLAGQLAEIGTGSHRAGEGSGKGDLGRDTETEDLAATSPGLELAVEGAEVRVRHANVREFEVRYYPMDVELLFSRNPFVQSYSGNFACIRPQEKVVAKVEADGLWTASLPESLASANLMIEVAGHGVTRSQARYANALSVGMVENYGRLTVTRTDDNRPVSRAYVKVYAEKTGGRVEFHKDGYTDLRGAFDYHSLSGGSPGEVRRYAILVLDDDLGAVVREAGTPGR